MPSVSSLALLAVAAVGGLASPPQRRAAPFNVELKHYQGDATMEDIVRNDRARIAAINGKAAVASGSVTNVAVTYLAPVNIGGKTWNLLIDTGSSNTWCGAHTPCEPTSSGKSTGDKVSVTYGSGSFSGTEYTDKVGFAGLTVKNQSIGAAKKATGFSKGIDGIIGFGPVDLTSGTVDNENDVPTFTNNLYKEGLIPVEVLGVSYRPEPGSSSSARNGILTLGGTDPSRYTGKITYHPRVTTPVVGDFWTVAVSSFGEQGLPLPGVTSADCVVDTGTTLVFIPPSALASFAALSGGEIDDTQGLLRYTQMPTATFDIIIDSNTYSLKPSQYIIPKAQYANLGLSKKYYWSYLADGAETVIDGVECLLGYFFIEQYYSVFDTTHSRVGFAKGK